MNRVQGQRARDEPEKVKQFSRSEMGQTEKLDTAFTVDNLILFICYVINCTDQVKHKTEKMKIIVEGAEKSLAIKDVSWENINKDLKQKGSWEAQVISQYENFTVERMCNVLVCLVSVYDYVY